MKESRSRRAALWLAVGVLATIALGGCRPDAAAHADPTRTEKMDAVTNEEPPAGSAGFRDALREPPAAVAPAATHPIRPGGSLTGVPAAPVPAGASWFRPYADDGRTSRLPRPLPPDGVALRVRWQAELDRHLAPVHVLDAGAGRCLVQGDQQWALFSDAGKETGRLLLGHSEAVVDAGRGLFYAADGNGLIDARKLTDGNAAFLLLPRSGKSFMHVYLARRGPRLLSVSVEQPDPFQRFAPSHSRLEAHHLGDPMRTDEDGLVVSASREAELLGRRVDLLAAMHGDTLVVATEGHLYRLDAAHNLPLTADLTGDFAPLALSVDEGGRAYLLVKAGGKESLWVVAPDGTRLLAADLPPGAASPARPPIVGYDHRIYVVGEKRIVCVAPDGTVAWQKETTAPCAGAAIDPDGRLLAACGPKLLAYGRDGAEREIFVSGGEPFVTPPITNGNGEILAATATRLYCLTAR